MGNTYVENTIQLLEAITDDCSNKYKSQDNKKCYKCFCVPTYIEKILTGEPTSPTNKPRKLIRNTNIIKYNPSQQQSINIKSHFLPIPAPIMIAESCCSDASSLDLGIATVDLPDNQSENTNNSSYSTIDINTSIDYDQNEGNYNEGKESIQDEVAIDYKLKVQSDIIQQNSLNICKAYFDEMNITESDNYASSEYSDCDKNRDSVDYFMDISNGPYHEEGIESDPELVRNF
eukprot:UN12193